MFRSEGISNSSAGASGGHPLLAPCLNGIGKFSHLIDLDFMGDLINHLRMLAGGGSNSDGSPKKFSRQLSVTERLRCCIVAFKVMKNNLDALNVDLQDFFVQLYSIMLEYRPGRLVSVHSKIAFFVVVEFYLLLNILWLEIYASMFLLHFFFDWPSFYLLLGYLKSLSLSL